MRWLREKLDRAAPHFEKGGRLHRWHPLWEAMDTFFYSPSSVTTTGAHVRDAVDRRFNLGEMLLLLMLAVLIASLPTVIAVRPALSYVLDVTNISPPWPACEDASARPRKFLAVADLVCHAPPSRLSETVSAAQPAMSQSLDVRVAIDRRAPLTGSLQTFSTVAAPPQTAVVVLVTPADAEVSASALPG